MKKKERKKNGKKKKVLIGDLMAYKTFKEIKFGSFLKFCVNHLINKCFEPLLVIPRVNHHKKFANHKTPYMDFMETY